MPDYNLKIFAEMEVREARLHAAAGGIAIHLHFIVPDRDTAPRCFVRDVDAGKPIAHVFGQSKDQLRALARSMGIGTIYIDKEDTDRQHIDFCGKPLEHLLKLAGDSIKNHLRRPKGQPTLF